ncbi:hypothetical protein ACHAXR_005857, partial [Thalassiosira sp. AJA248-18]
KKRAAEIFDEALFKQPPPNEDCPICFLRLPLNRSDKQFKSCCGKIICIGCAYADMIARRSAERMCPFCRAPLTTSHEGAVEMLRKGTEAGDFNAMRNLGYQFYKGDGVPQDYKKALELWHQSAKLGCVESHCNIGTAYCNGKGVEKDKKKAKCHWELGAMGGDVIARYNIGIAEWNAGNMNRAMKHFMISAGFGHDLSLKDIQNGFSGGHVTKDEFEKTLRAHKESKDEMQSDHRDAAREYVQRTQLHQ